MSEPRAVIDQVISAPAWAGVPGLHLGIQRYADLEGDEAAGYLVSAVDLDGFWLSVRVSRVEGDDSVADWIEWLAPRSVSRASQAAIDHFAARKMDCAVRQLKRRSDTARPGDYRLPEIPAEAPPDPDPRGIPMAKKAATPEPAPAPAEATPTKPRGKPGPKPGKAAARPAGVPEPAPAPAAPKPTRRATAAPAVERRSAAPGPATTRSPAKTGKAAARKAAPRKPRAG